MGCISASGYRIGQSLEVSGYKAHPNLSAAGYSRYQPIRVSGVAVCPLTSAPYIEVTPQVVWLTPENLFSGDFDIISNVKWLIE